MKIHVDYEIKECSDCPFYKPDPENDNIGTCIYWRKHGSIVVQSDELDKGCDLLEGDCFQVINKEIYKG